MLTAENENFKVVVTHLTIVIAIPNNDQLLTKEKVFGQSISWKFCKSITLQDIQKFTPNYNNKNSTELYCVTSFG